MTRSVLMSATALATFAVRIFLNDSIIGCNRIAGGEEICISFATGLNVIEASDLHFNRFVPHQRVAETIIAGVEDRALKRRKPIRSAECALKSNNVCHAIDRAILAEDREKIWFGLEGHDGTAS